MKKKPTFGEVLREMRKGSTRTIAEVCDHMNWSKPKLMDLEHGRIGPPAASEILRLCQFMGMDSDELLRAAASQRFRVDLDLKGANPLQVQTAVMLARLWSDLDRGQLERIMEVLEIDNGKRI